VSGSALAFSILVLTAATATATGPADPEGWQPPAGATFQIQLQGRVDLSYDADVYDIDLFDSPRSVVSQLHELGRHVVCYVSAGSYERWRPDADDFPREVLGKGLAGWPGERWLDIRKLGVLKPIMQARVRMCARKGFDGIDFDNVDAFTNETGFPLTKRDQLRYLRFLARAAHARGLAAGLKNLPQLARELQPRWEFAVNEQCFQYDECEEYLAFIDAGKPVFNIEYSLEIEDFCPQANEWGFTSQRKDRDLSADREACWPE
jgi:hypothetical protein